MVVNMCPFLNKSTRIHEVHTVSGIAGCIGLDIEIKARGASCGSCLTDSPVKQ